VSGGNHGAFLVPNIIVDRYINEASASALKFILYVLRRSDSFTHEDICKDLRLTQPEFNSAINYWTNNGILKVNNGEISFNPSCIENDSKFKPKLLNSPPEYEMSEIVSIIDQNKILKSLIQSIQIRLNRQLSPSNIKIIYGLIDYYGFSPEIIFSLVDHCCDIGKPNIKYIEQVAYGWYREGITTEEAVNRYLNEYNKRKTNEYMVRKIFGIGERSLTTNEQKYIKTWVEDYGYGEDMIRFAYEKAVDTTGKVKMVYIDKILKAWFEKGYKTVEEAAAEPPPEFKKAKSKKKKENEKDTTYDLKDFMEWSFNELYAKESSDSKE